MTEQRRVLRLHRRESHQANEAISPDATTSETKTARMQIPIPDADTDLGPTNNGAGPVALGDW